MRLSELLQRLDDQLDDVGSVNWPEAQRVRWADIVVSDLMRQLVEVDKGYCDLEILVKETDWREDIQLVQDYRLPQWVGNVVEVWRLTENPDSNNPFTNTVTTMRGLKLLRKDESRSSGLTPVDL